jgi:hypothetical protein
VSTEINEPELAARAIDGDRVSGGLIIAAYALFVVVLLVIS